MIVQPGSGYGFNSSGYGVSLDIANPFPDESGSPLHPFKIVNVSIRSSGEEGATKSIIYQVQSGTVNNLVPVLDDYISETTVKLDRTTDGAPDPPTAELASEQYNETSKTSYIYLRAGPNTESPFKFPSSDVESARYPAVGGDDSENQPDTDEYAYLLIGSITVDNIETPTSFTVTQYVASSLWSERFKCGSATAVYWWSSI